MRKKFSFIILVALLSAPITHARAQTDLGSGHITAGGPWIGFRSLTVLQDRDSVDGFFLDVPPELWGETLSARVTRNGSALPYALSMNFHGSTPGTFGRNWLGGCVGYLIDEKGEANLAADIDSCLVPTSAVTVELTAYYGTDLDVAVCCAPEPDETAAAPYSSADEKEVLARTT